MAKNAELGICTHGWKFVGMMLNRCQCNAWLPDLPPIKLCETCVCFSQASVDFKTKASFIIIFYEHDLNVYIHLRQ